MPDDSDMNQEETGPGVNPFQDVFNDNLKEAAIQKDKYVLGMIETCMKIDDKLIFNQVEKIKLLVIQGKLRKFNFIEYLQVGNLR